MAGRCGGWPLGLQHTQNDFLIDRKKSFSRFLKQDLDFPENLHTTQAGSAIDEFWGFSIKIENLTEMWAEDSNLAPHAGRYSF